MTDAAPRARLEIGRLWLLAAALGVVTAYLTMSILHDTSRRREATHLVTQTLANEAAGGLSERASAFRARGHDSVPRAGALLRDSVFTPYLRALTASAAPIAELDSASIQLANPNGGFVIGKLSELHLYRASAAATGALQGWTVTAAIHPAQLPDAIVAPLPHERLWLLGLLGVMTIVVIVLAIGSSQRQLQLAHARSDFVAGVSHELRMPLAQILLAGETLSMRRDRDGNERLTLSRSIVREARRLVGIVENILFFSRSDRAGLSVRVQPLRASELFDGIVESVELAVADAGQTVAIGAGGDLRMMADADLMRHAVVNLVDNAMKYGKRGQCIRLSAVQHSVNRVTLIVDDDGPGIPESERTRVFEAYERLARDQSSERTGTGLGLSIVKRIAGACGGRAAILTSPSGGTRATIELQAAP